MNLTSCCKNKFVPVFSDSTCGWFTNLVRYTGSLRQGTWCIVYAVYCLEMGVVTSVFITPTRERTTRLRWLHNNTVHPRIKVKVHTLDIAPLRETPPQKRSGMARVFKGSLMWPMLLPLTRWLQVLQRQFDRRSIHIRLQFDRATTIRPLHYDCRPNCLLWPHCGLNKQTGQRDCGRDVREWLSTFPFPPIPIYSIPIPSHPIPIFWLIPIPMGFPCGLFPFPPIPHFVNAKVV